MFPALRKTIKFDKERESSKQMANTKAITDTAERKKVKRTARKKATPKPKRTEPRGSNKQKLKKLARGAAKR
jgi:hypothetical protein